MDTMTKKELRFAILQECNGLHWVNAAEIGAPPRRRLILDDRWSSCPPDLQYLDRATAERDAATLRAKVAAAEEKRTSKYKLPPVT
jgi:hypothetical protein